MLGISNIQARRLKPDSSEYERRDIVLKTEEFMFDFVDTDFVRSREPENSFTMHRPGKHIWFRTIISSANLWTLRFAKQTGHESDSWLIVGVERLIDGVRLTLHNYRPYRRTSKNYYDGADYTNKYKMINRDHKREIIVDVISSSAGAGPDGNTIAQWFTTAVDNQNLERVWYGDRYGTEVQRIYNPTYERDFRAQKYLHG